MNNPASRSSVAWLLFASDIIGLIACFNLAFMLRLDRFLDWQSPLLYGLIIIYILGLYLADTYRPEIKISGLWIADRLLIGIFFTVAVITSFVYLSGLWGSEPLVGRGILLISIVFFTIWAVVWRLITGKWVRFQEKQSRFLVLEGGNKALQFGVEYHHAYPRAEFVFLTKDSEVAKKIHQGKPGLLIDKLDNFAVWSEQYWSGVLLDDTAENMSDETIRQLMEMRLRGIYIYSLADFYEEFWQKIPPSFIQDDWFAFTSGFNILHDRFNVKLKHLVDVLAASLLVLIVLPIALIASLAIRLDSPGPIFYSQVRTGLNGKKFKVYKFRSMYQDAEKRGIQWAATKDPRITRVGRLLRAMRIDELPQLWNVIKGEMSLIGPRPERPEFDSKLRQEIPYYDVRYLVKPGITGWAQVMYDYGASVEDAYQKVAYDLYYIKNYSLLLDLAIALKTVRTIILGKGR
jgi:exopolysaccharide biosynthesis polyprenyl glycosylphosphotransferase